MPVTRRLFLMGTAGALLMRAVPVRATSRATFLSARSDGDGSPFATGFDGDGRIAFDLPLAARGHGAASRPGSDEAILFGRRPGDAFTVIDTRAGAIRTTIAAASGRTFNGHGLFRPDGARLFASETARETGDGMIGLYDAADRYRRLGEFVSGGLDPHDMRWLSNGRIVVANGGILEDPAAPGIKLNLATMESSLAIFDPRDGTRESVFRLDPALFQLSLRHLALDASDGIAVAMQYEGPDIDRVPLVAQLRAGATALEPLDPPAPVLRKLDQYCGSAACDASGRLLAVTSPRGGCAIFWNIAERRFLGTVDLADGCGIAPAATPGTFLLSGGLGGMLRCDPAAGGETVIATSDPLAPRTRWDNHILALEV